MMSGTVGGRPGMPVMGVTQSHMVTHGVITLLACSQEPRGGHNEQSASLKGGGTPYYT